jgi:CRP/FNR family transcriptional regulator, cyclic AMP receptor protein
MLIIWQPSGTGQGIHCKQLTRVARVKRMKQGASLATAEHISALAACFGCDHGNAALIADQTSERTFPHRSIVALRGDVSEHLFLVIEGMASFDLFSIDGQYARLSGYGPGELFGAYPLTTTHRADVSAQGNLRVLAIETASIAALVAGNIAIAYGMAALMARQLDMVLDRMAARIGLSAQGRFYQALLKLADEDGWIRPAPILSAVAIGVNTTRETASRGLAALLRRGIVDRCDDGLRIIGRRLLEELVV